MHLRSIWPNNTPSQKEISEPLFFKVLRTFRRSLVRQISEAVAIHGCMATVLLNSRSEWEQPMVDRVMVLDVEVERMDGRTFLTGGRKSGGELPKEIRLIGSKVFDVMKEEQCTD